MAFYADAAIFYSVMEDLFGQVLRQPTLLNPLRESRLLLHITATLPDASLLLDARSDSPRFLAGGVPAGRPTLGLRVPADMLHDIWLGEIRLRDAYWAGKIQLTTSPLKALSLLLSLQGLFRYVESIYPQVLKRHGLL